MFVWSRVKVHLTRSVHWGMTLRCDPKVMRPGYMVEGGGGYQGHHLEITHTLFSHNWPLGAYFVVQEIQNVGYFQDGHHCW